MGATTFGIRKGKRTKKKKKKIRLLAKGDNRTFLFSRNFLLQNFFIFSLAALFNSNKILKQHIKIGGHRTCFLVKYFEVSQIPTCVLVVLKSENLNSIRTWVILFEVGANSRLGAFSNGLTVFYLHLEQPSDQENKNGFAAERLWFLEHRAASTLFRHLKNFLSSSA